MQLIKTNTDNIERFNSIWFNSTLLKTVTGAGTNSVRREKINTTLKTYRVEINHSRSEIKVNDSQPYKLINTGQWAWKLNKRERTLDVENLNGFIKDLKDPESIYKILLQRILKTISTF